ncbi:hypothetical protein EUGRSUZ_E00671 [Eucalyptus grandis]|uniref:HMA domain-containing protein n=2 Tax=Eucalyptus grandis TaxID=71139 RepID=A0A059C174_EUCGR|nr:hypothetical protein EUGRSUZ_E00671 [Eucalyptus grandis]
MSTLLPVRSSAICRSRKNVKIVQLSGGILTGLMQTVMSALIPVRSSAICRSCKNVKIVQLSGGILTGLMQTVMSALIPVRSSAICRRESLGKQPFGRESVPTGIGSLSMDSKDSKLTVSGDFDPVEVVNKLRKSWHTDIVSVGPAKEDDGKKDGGKKEEGKKDDQVTNLVKAYQTYVPYQEAADCVIC